MATKLFRYGTTAFGIVGFVTCGYIILIITTPGEYTNWSDWAPCTATCGDGIETRFRVCSNPPPGIFGLDCEGPKTESKKCYVKPCPIDGGYTEWGKFGECDKKCGGGTRTRTRSCTNPSPQFEGKTCDALGLLEEKLACNIDPCPINGGFSEWGLYTECSLEGGEACGKGKKIRIRTCNSPVPQYGGKPCEGLDKETVDCEIPCPTDSITTLSGNRTTPPLATTAKPV